MIGRTHGIHAEPTTFGLKLAGWYAEVGRQIARLKTAREEIAYGKLSGAVGTLAHLPPEVEAFVLKKCGLKPEPVATQVVPRDRHAHYFTVLAGIASSLERFSMEVRHLQRTEVYEAEEFFSPGQKGSSAMPHKRNPVLSENLVGLARLVRSYAIAALENVALWHERDISHSSVERVIGPDADILLDFMLSRFTGLISKLLVYPENMKKNMEKMGKLIFSESILLALIEKGLTREAAYRLVQRNAMRVWEEGGDFEKYLTADAEVTELIAADEIKAALNLEHHLQRVDYIFKRVFDS